MMPIPCRTRTVRITRQHIAAARAGHDEGDSHSCPIARAVNDALIPGYQSSIYANTNILPQGLNRVVATAPNSREMRRWMNRFDNGHPVRPRTFRVTLPAYMWRR